VTMLSSDRHETEEASTDCPTCHGRGYFYRDFQEILALVISASRNPVFYQIYGERARGMASITLESEHMAAAWDRFTVIGDNNDQKTVVQTREVRKREGAIDVLRYPIVSTLLETALSEDEPTVLAPTDNDGVVIVRSDWRGRTIPTILEYGIDYRVTAAGAIEWIGAIGQAATGQFTITGTAGGVVPVGTVWRYTPVTGPTLDFVTLETVEIPVSGTVTTTLKCATEGVVGNVSVQNMSVSILHSLDCVNDAAICQLGTSGGVNGNCPPVGGRYSVTYWAHPVYVVQDVPHLHRDTRVALKNPNGPQWARMVFQVHAWLETMGPPHGFSQDIATVNP